MGSCTWHRLLHFDDGLGNSRAGRQEPEPCAATEDDPPDTGEPRGAGSPHRGEVQGVPEQAKHGTVQDDGVDLLPERQAARDLAILPRLMRADDEPGDIEGTNRGVVGPDLSRSSPVPRQYAAARRAVLEARQGAQCGRA
jgi:hypothetical protein